MSRIQLELEIVSSLLNSSAYTQQGAQEKSHSTPSVDSSWALFSLSICLCRCRCCCCVSMRKRETYLPPLSTSNKYKIYCSHYSISSPLHVPSPTPCVRVGSFLLSHFSHSQICWFLKDITQRNILKCLRIFHSNDYFSAVSVVAKSAEAKVGEMCREEIYWNPSPSE